MGAVRRTKTTKQPDPEVTVKVVQTLDAPPPQPKRPVMFIHGLWLHASSWRPWLDHFAAASYDASAPGWPDFPDTVAETREYPDFMADQSIELVTDHYARLMRDLPVKPAVVGHSFGGLIAQKLLDRDLVVAAVSIDPAPIKGVLPLPFSQLRASWPALGNPLTIHRTVTLTPRQFRYAFANRLTESEAATLYYDWTIPAPGRPLWQVAFSNFNRHPDNAVDVHKSRGPLLLMAGRDDHIVPASTTRIVQRLYKDSSSVTDLKEWSGRGHSLVIDHGWRQLADYALEWLETQGVHIVR